MSDNRPGQGRSTGIPTAIRYRNLEDVDAGPDSRPVLRGNTKIISESSNRVLKVAGGLDVSGAAALRDSLRDWLTEQPELLVDLSGADSCDAAVLQVLCAARKSAARLGKPFQVISPSATLLETSAALGLRLEDWAAPEATDAI